MEKYNNLISHSLIEYFDTGNIGEVQKIVGFLGVERFLKLSYGLKNHFTSYLNACALQLFKENKEVSWLSIWRLGVAYGLPYAWLKKLGPEYEELMTSIVDAWRLKQEEQRQQVYMVPGQLIWIIPHKDVQGTRTVRLDFSGLTQSLTLESQAYLLSWFNKGEYPLGISRRFHHLVPIMKALKSPSLTQVKSFLDLTYVDVRTLFDILQQQRKNDGRKKYALKSIQSHFSEMRLLFDWLLLNENQLLKNPFRRFKFHNINSFVKSAEYIPEDIVVQLTKVIKDCPQHVQRIWLIMMNTGARGVEIINLKQDCLIFNENEQLFYLRFLASKTSKSRRKRGLDEYHSVPLSSQEIVDIVRQQINETEELRKLNKTEYIFISYANRNRRTAQGRNVVRYLSANITSSINNCIKRHQVKDQYGNIWRYSNHQCRKTLGVKLLTEGSSISEVGEILNHSEEKTTRQFYQDIDAMKIANLDKELFAKLFESMDEEIRQAYSDHEFEQLKSEIMVGARETPEGHGSCLKHVSFGPCKKRSCVGCSLLLTGPQKLPMWQKLFNEQKKYLEDLAQTMLGQGINDYDAYRDYQAESHLLATYKDTINKIERFMAERAIDIGTT